MNGMSFRGIVRRWVCLTFALILAPTSAMAQHGDWCACGKHRNAPISMQVDHTQANFRNAAIGALARWDRHSNVFSWGTGDGRAGPNGVNEIIFFSPATTQNLYGLTIDENVFGVTYINPRSAFGGFNECPAPTGTTCGFFSETDVIMNAAFTRGWTTNPPRFNDTGPASYVATSLHELGHVLGLHHNFDSLTTMNYYEDFATLYLSLSDGRAAREFYPSQARTVTDIGTYPFRFSGSMYAGTTVASATPTTVQAGDLLTVRNFTIENVALRTLNNVRLRLYLSADTNVSTSDHLLGTVFFDTFTTWWDTTGMNFRVPAGVPAGRYYLGAIAFFNSTQTDGVTYNNRWVLDASRRITVEAAAPTVSDLTPARSAVLVSKTDLAPGEAFRVWALAKNLGPAATSAQSILRYKRSANSTIGFNDTQFGWDRVPVLAAGATTSQQTALGRAPAAPGRYWIGVCVDPVSNETNRGNNCSAQGRQITVVGAGTNQAPLLQRLVVTRTHLSNGRSAEVRADPTATAILPGVPMPGGAELPRVITLNPDSNGFPDPDNPINIAARASLPSSTSLVVAEGASDPDGGPNPLRYEWRRPPVGATLYSTGSQGSAYVAGAVIKNLSQYNRNSVIYEAPDIQWPVLDSNTSIGGLQNVQARVSDGDKTSPWRFHPLQYDRKVQLDLENVRGVVNGNTLVMTLVATPKFADHVLLGRQPDRFEPLGRVYFRIICNDPIVDELSAIGVDEIFDLSPAGGVTGSANVSGRHTAARVGGAEVLQCRYPLTDNDGNSRGLLGMSTRITVVASALSMASPPAPTNPFVVNPPPDGDSITTIDTDGATLADSEVVTLKEFETSKQFVRVFDSGSIADDSFQLFVDSNVNGQIDGSSLGPPTAPGGASRYEFSLSSGNHELCLKVVLAPDNIGSFTVELLGGGVTFTGGGTQQTGGPSEGAVACWGITVP